MIASPSSPSIAPPRRALRRDDGLSPAQSRGLVAAVACAHLAGLWGLLQVAAVREAVAQVAPMVVDLIAPAQPEAPPPPPPPAAAPVQRPRPEPPILAAASPVPVPAEAFTAPPPPPPEPIQAVPAPPAPPAPVAAPAPPPAPPARKLIPATAVQYLVEPPFELPRASRRAGEHGVVWLRVVVSAEGLPLLVRVQKSSGYPRLDEQALWAMRQARFKPYTEDGRAIEVEATAPVDYPLD
jgi:periplasmic protein TonB